MGGFSGEQGTIAARWVFAMVMNSGLRSRARWDGGIVIELCEKCGLMSGK